MRALHSLAPGDFGGLEEVVIRLTAGLHERGHDIHVAVVLTDDQDNHPFVADLRERGVCTHTVVVGSRGYLTELTAIRKLARRIAPAVIHTHGYRPGVIHKWAAEKLGIRMVTTVHGFTGGGLRNRSYEWVQLRSARRYDAVVAVSRAMTPRLTAAGILPARTHVIPNAWAPRHVLEPVTTARAALGVPPSGFHVGWMGRLSHEKGPDILIEACRMLGGLDATISFIGDGPLIQQLRGAAGEVANVDIRFHGSIAAAARLMRAFDVLVISSRTEGTPIVLFEAMEASVPVVAASVGGVPDVVNGDTAILVRSEAPEALAAAIRTVHQQRPVARARAKLAWETLAARYGIPPWINRHEALYASLRGLRRAAR